MLGTRDRRIAWSQSVWEPLAGVAVDGPEVAFLKGNTWFPAYALAMRRDAQWNPMTTVLLSDDEAREYVGGNTLPCAHRGWAVATWQGRSLGWLKGDGRRAKNHLPKPARFMR